MQRERLAEASGANGYDVAIGDEGDEHIEGGRTSHHLRCSQARTASAANATFKPVVLG